MPQTARRRPTSSTSSPNHPTSSGSIQPQVVSEGQSADNLPSTSSHRPYHQGLSDARLLEPSKQEPGRRVCTWSGATCGTRLTPTHTNGAWQHYPIVSPDCTCQGAGKFRGPVACHMAPSCQGCPSNRPRRQRLPIPRGSSRMVGQPRRRSPVPLCQAPVSRT